jgi:carboxymethylenebutenolidase
VPDHHAHHHAHGPANRGRVVHTTAAPLFVCEPAGPAAAAVVAVHGEPGIDADFETGLRAIAAEGAVAVAPYLYFRDGGPDYPAAEQARAAFAELDPADVDIDVDAALAHLTSRLGVPTTAIRLAGRGPGLAAAERGAHRHGLPAPVLL